MLRKGYAPLYSNENVGDIGARASLLGNCKLQKRESERRGERVERGGGGGGQERNAGTCGGYLHRSRIATHHIDPLATGKEREGEPNFTYFTGVVIRFGRYDFL